MSGSGPSPSGNEIVFQAFYLAARIATDNDIDEDTGQNANGVNIHCRILDVSQDRFTLDLLYLDECVY